MLQVGTVVCNEEIDINCCNGWGLRYYNLYTIYIFAFVFIFIFILNFVRVYSYNLISHLKSGCFAISIFVSTFFKLICLLQYIFFNSVFIIIFYSFYYISLNKFLLFYFVFKSLFHILYLSFVFLF